MSASITDPEALSSGLAAAGLDPTDWPRAVRRVNDYLRAMGVSDAQEIERLKKFNKSIQAQFDRAKAENDENSALAKERVELVAKQAKQIKEAFIFSIYIFFDLVKFFNKRCILNK